MLRNFKIIPLIIIALLLNAQNLKAQADLKDLSNSDTNEESAGNSEEQSSENDVEALFKAEAQKSKESPVNDEYDQKPVAPLKSMSNLKQLEPFEDIGVIQKKYLQKTKRFELFLAPTTTLNDPFFVNWGGAGRLGFAFSEQLSIEFTYLTLNTNRRDVNNDLLARGVEASSLVAPKGYTGGSVRWSPIYGKFGVMDKQILHFDMFFSAGAGITQTNQNQSPATLSLGAGQIFALTRNFAMRLEIDWNMFYYDSTATKKKEFADNVYLLFGISWYFPNARSR